METERLLDEEDRFKLLILQYLEIEKNNYIHVSKLYELTGLTKFRMDNLLSDLSTDLLIFSENPRILIDLEGIVETKNLSLKIVKKIKLEYLERSTNFALLKDMLTTQSSIEVFSKKNHLSKSQVYIKRKNLKVFLSQLGVKLKKNAFVGDEVTIRNILFSIFYDVYNGITFPFPEEIYGLSNKLIAHYEHWLNLKMRNSEKTKLRLIIGISFYRAGNSFTDKIFFLKEKKIESFSHYPISIFSEFGQFTHETIIDEIHYILSYIVLNIEGTYPEDLVAEEVNAAFEEADRFSEEITNQILSGLHFSKKLTEDQINKMIQTYRTLIKKSNRNRFLFDVDIRSFYFESSTQFFMETYPYITKVIRESINKTIVRWNSKRNLKSVQLFFDYIFILFSVCPVKYLEQPVYVCIDFTLGVYYNEYIRKQIEGFKQFNLYIVDKLNADTNIYISDCMIENLNIEQIIWKSPPTADDWEEFGNKVIEAKNKSE